MSVATKPDLEQQLLATQDTAVCGQARYPANGTELKRKIVSEDH